MELFTKKPNQSFYRKWIYFIMFCILMAILILPLQIDAKKQEEIIAKDLIRIEGYVYDTTNVNDTIPVDSTLIVITSFNFMTQIDTVYSNIDGYYFYECEIGWSGIIQAEKVFYTGFNPDFYEFENLQSDTTDITFTCSRVKFSIDGRVVGINSENDTIPLENTKITYTENNGSVEEVYSTNTGNYQISLYYGWNGISDAEKFGYSFDTTYQYTFIDQSFTNQDFTGYLLNYEISGVITDEKTNLPLSQVNLVSNSSTVDTSDNNGAYSFNVQHGWVGTIIPQKTGYQFTPNEVVYDSVFENKTENYSAILEQYTISGKVTENGVALEGVQITFNTQPSLINDPYYEASYPSSTNSDGEYSMVLFRNWRGLITPSKYNYTFEPGTITIIQDLTSNTEDQDFDAFENVNLSMIIEDVALCLNQSIELLPQVTGGEEPYQFEWFVNDSLVGSASSLTVSPAATTTYLIKVSDTQTTVTGTLTVTVHDLPAPELINVEGDTLVCANRAGAIYEIAEPQENHQYTFHLLSGGVVVDIGDIGNRIAINWEADTGTHILEVVAENQFGCISAKEVPIHISGAAAPSPTEIVRKTNSNILISMDTTAPNYQWGFIHRNTWQITKPAGATDRFHNFDSGFNPDVNIYFVDRWFGDGGCVSRSFFGSSAVGIHDLVDDELFAVMPNPFTDYLLIASSVDTEAAITLVNQHGSIILRDETDMQTGGYYRMNTSILSRGIYILRIEYDNRIFTTKILKH